MSGDYFFSNNSFEDQEEEGNNSLFLINPNQPISSFENPDYDNSNYCQNFDIEKSNDTENNNMIINIDNSGLFKNSLFQENMLNNDFTKLSPISSVGYNDDSFKQQSSSNNTKNNSSDITSNNSFSIKDKSQPKKPENNNINKSKKESNNNTNNKNDKNNLNKKRRPRVHLEDLDIDPEIIKDKKYQTIGDKVFTSKNQIITENDKKEIRAIRNRISAQKSRDRKKAEFISLNEKLKYLTAQLEKKILIIQNYEKVACSHCKSKMIEINKKYMEDEDVNNNFNFSSDQSEIPIPHEEELVLEEKDSFTSGKKNSFLGKISTGLIAVVCLVGIIFCIFEGGFILNNISNNYTNKIELRHLTYEDNKTSTYEDNDINVPLPIEAINKNKANDFLQICHDKFTLEMIANITKKKEQKNRLLMKSNLRFNKGPILDKDVCFETNSIINNNYIYNSSFTDNNNLPIESNNIILNNNLSNKIISFYVKDYDELKRYVNGRSLSLQEQIEIEAKNSQDGCVYLQIIIPKNKIKNNFENRNTTTVSEYQSDFFEIRCKIFAYNNYYNEVTSSH